MGCSESTPKEPNRVKKISSEDTSLNYKIENSVREVLETLEKQRTEDKEKLQKELHDAILEENLIKLKNLLQRGTNLDGPSGTNGWTPLHVAAREGKMASAVWLLENGADVEARDLAGHTPLHEAVKWKQDRVTEVLLQHGASINFKDSSGETPAAKDGK